jgi:hypothetical protein
MKKIKWVVGISDNGEMGIVEEGDNIGNTMEDHLLIVGILESLKEIHVSKLKTKFDKTSFK